VLARHQAQEAELRAADWLEIGTPPAKIAPGESLVESRDRGEKGGVQKRAKERVLRENVASTRSVTLHCEMYGADPLGSQLHGSVGKLPAWVGVGAAARPLGRSTGPLDVGGCSVCDPSFSWLSFRRGVSVGDQPFISRSGSRAKTNQLQVWDGPCRLGKDANRAS